MKLAGLYKYLITLQLMTLPLIATGRDQAESTWEIEGAWLSANKNQISGYQQSSATTGWKKSSPNLRIEYWSKNKDDWHVGWIVQPIALRYQENLSSALTIEGKTFASGESVSLNYDFHTFRLTANKQLLSLPKGGYLRGGGSVILRATGFKISGTSQTYAERRYGLAPVFNIEARTPLTGGHDFFTRMDVFPSIGKNGLHDVFIGVRHQTRGQAGVDAGIRFFGGGYDPNKLGRYANQAGFQSIVVRFVF